MEKYIPVLIILLPVISGVGCYMFKGQLARSFLAVFSITILACSTVVLGYSTFKNGGYLSWDFEYFKPPVDYGWVVRFLCLFLLVYVIYLGLRQRKYLIAVLAILQGVPYAVFTASGLVDENYILFAVDYPALAVILYTLITALAMLLLKIGLFKSGSVDTGLLKIRQPGKIAAVVVFTGLVCGLVLVDNIIWVYFYWTALSLCSYTITSDFGGNCGSESPMKVYALNLVVGIIFAAAIVVSGFSGDNTMHFGALAGIYRSSALTGFFTAGLGLYQAALVTVFSFGTNRHAGRSKQNLKPEKQENRSFYKA